MANIDKMSREQLIAAKKKAMDELKQLEVAEAQYDQRRLKELREEVETLLAKEGYTLAQLVDGKVGKKAAKAKAAPKYKHPENPAQTWSGRGRQPVWFKEFIENGGDESELAIA